MTGYGNQPISQQAAKELLALPLEDKVLLSREKIAQWYSAWGGKCYVSFSGGKDSTVLAYLAAQELSRYRTPIYPLTLVFVNTGLEYPEIQHFVNDYATWLQKQFPRIDVRLVRLRPKLNIRQVLTRYGYPVIGKKQARFIRDLQNAHGQNDATVNLYLTGYNRQGVLDDETGGQVALSQGCAVPNQRAVLRRDEKNARQAVQRRERMCAIYRNDGERESAARKRVEAHGLQRL